MKWGVAYNVWEDAIELLEYSVKSIRESVDFISVVYQTTSNTGQKGTIDVLKELVRMRNEGLINEYYLFFPIKNANPHQNEIAKRNLGLDRCRINGCDYMASMDADELYVKSEFEYMKKAMVDGRHMAAACQMLTYYKSPEWILDPPESYYVSLFYKIDKDSQFIIGAHTPVLIDPTRRMPSAGWKIFERSEIQMHHFSYVRRDIIKKLTNSSAFVNYQHVLGQIIQDYEAFPANNKANIAGGYHSVKKIEPLFNIQL